jgi:hypothetical protein
LTHLKKQDEESISEKATNLPREVEQQLLENALKESKIFLSVHLAFNLKYSESGPAQWLANEVPALYKL